LVTRLLLAALDGERLGELLGVRCLRLEWGGGLLERVGGGKMTVRYGENGAWYMGRRGG